MWSAWLLRTDVRANAALNDAEAQREFVVWWLLYGQVEYPAGWWFGPEQVAIAMEPVTMEGWSLPRLVRRLYRDRHDVQAAFPLVNADAVGDLLCWYRLSAPVEAKVAPALPAEFLQLTEAPSGRLPWAGTPAVPRMAVTLHARLPDLQKNFDPSTPAARAALAGWYAGAGQHLITIPTSPPHWVEVWPSSHRAGDARTNGFPSGVNLIGFARAELGIGEDVRSLSRALETVGFAHVIVNVNASAHVRAHDNSRAHIISPVKSYPTNIFCLTAWDTVELFLKQAPELFAGSFNIGYWPWEFEQFPAVWMDAFDLVDEVWAATRFQQRAFQATNKVPVFLMPPAVLLSSATELRRAKPRRRKPRRFRFIFPFDPNSFLSRKNPVGAIRAFRRAFPTCDRSVELVLRVNGIPDRSAGWRTVRAAMRGDTRIIVISGTMGRAASLALLRDANCLVSPHRSEGFGRNIAEAIALSVPVLGTGGSGPDDFLRREERIAFRRRDVGPNEYPFAEGLSWNDLVVADLARNMRRIRTIGQSIRPKAPNRGRATQHAPRTAGFRYRRRLTGED